LHFLISQKLPKNHPFPDSWPATDSGNGTGGGRREVTAFDFHSRDGAERHRSGSPELGIRADEDDFGRMTGATAGDEDDEFGDFTEARSQTAKTAATTNNSVFGAPPPPVIPPPGATPTRRPAQQQAPQSGDLLGLGLDFGTANPTPAPTAGGWPGSPTSALPQPNNSTTSPTTGLDSIFGLAAPAPPSAAPQSNDLLSQLMFDTTPSMGQPTTTGMAPASSLLLQPTKNGTSSGHNSAMGMDNGGGGVQLSKTWDDLKK